MRTLKNILMASTVALGAVASGQAAQAATLITTWAHSYSNDWSGVTYTGPQAGNASLKGTCVSGGFDRIYWGSPATGANGGPANCSDSSSLDVTDTGAGALITDDVLVNTNVANAQDAAFWTAGASLRHNNNVIWFTDISRISLNTANIDFSLVLTPTSPAGPALSPINVTFNLQFQETPNVAGTCDPAGAGAGGAPCPDYFILLNPVNLVQSFTLDGYEYFLTLDLDFANATGVYQDAGNPLKFWTRESAQAVLPTRFKIEAREAVPEPASMALFGLGMAGLGMVRRRRAA